MSVKQIECVKCTHVFNHEYKLSKRLKVGKLVRRVTKCPECGHEIHLRLIKEAE